MSMLHTLRGSSLRHLAALLVLAAAAGCADAGGPVAAPTAGPSHNFEKDPTIRPAITTCGTPTRLGMNDFDLDGPIRSGARQPFLLLVYDANNCRIYPSGGVTWKLTNTSVAEFIYPNSNTGPSTEIRGKLAGYGTLEVEYAGLKGVYSFSVVPGDPYRVAVVPDSVVLLLGGTAQFTASVFDQAGNPLSKSLTWTSSNTTVASVSQTSAGATVQAGSTISAAGTATITATVTGTAVKGTGKVRVTTPECYCPPGITCTCMPA